MVGFDTETTGVSPTEDRLVTASIIVVTGPEVTKHYWLANPGVAIPDRAAAVHGITTEIARRDGQPIRDVLDDVAQLLEVHCTQGHPIVAFNGSFDLTLLECELNRHDLPTLQERLGRSVGPLLDPLYLDKTYDKWRKGRRNLESVAQHYGVWRSDAFHNAEADVLATLRVLAAIMRKFPEITEEPLDVLEAKQRESYLDSARYFARRAAERGQVTSEPMEWPVAGSIYGK
ncbi:MAG: DNA polymerase III subunit epsilon [Arcanobacterium sp.]|nr:DNA polymerase III subunit epsilon [Arcanobacterium sp.]